MPLKLLVWVTYSLARPVVPAGRTLLAEPGGGSFGPFGLLAPVSNMLAAVRGNPPKLTRGPPEHHERCGGGAGRYPDEQHEERHL